MSRWIDKRAGFVKKDARADKVVCHFTEDGNIRGSQDSVNEFGIPTSGVRSFTANTTLDPKHSGHLHTFAKADGLTVTLPSANKGCMVFPMAVIADITSNQFRITPASGDSIGGGGITIAADKYVELAHGNVTGKEFVVLYSNGVDTWYIGETNSTNWARQS